MEKNIELKVNKYELHTIELALKAYRIKMLEDQLKEDVLNDSLQYHQLQNVYDLSLMIKELE